MQHFGSRSSERILSAFWSIDCRQWASTDFRNRGKKANKVEAAERGFLNHPVRKVVCIAGAADRGDEWDAGDGDLIAISPANAEGFRFQLGCEKPCFRQRKSVINSAMLTTATGLAANCLTRLEQNQRSNHQSRNGVCPCNVPNCMDCKTDESDDGEIGA